MKGRIIKGIGGFYYVLTPDSGLYECKARGIFRKRHKKPLVGDEVEIDLIDEAGKQASITEILPRKNELIRPAAANVDQAMILFALKDPDPDSLLLDRFLIMVEQQKIPAFVVFNKSDLVSMQEIEDWENTYAKCGAPLMFANLENGIGAGRIREILKGKTTILAGPSGVGKSTLTNLLQDHIKMETGDISKKLGRGKHTTRHAELIAIDADTYLCDTPGFTSLITELTAKEELQFLFPEIAQFHGKCKFASCVHRKEPDCAVKNAVEAGFISQKRYRNYLKLFDELEEKEKFKY